ncbi:MAG: hypothetical protein AB7D51_12260 [Desulfovibrionaceae bacterium]
MHTYSVPMHRMVTIIFVLSVAVVAGAIVWCFRSGLTWSGICALAVAGPLTLMYWYMLLVNPARTSISVSAEGITVEAPPFLKLAIPREDISRTFEGSLDDENLGIEKLDGAMRFGGYRNGRFVLKNGRKAVILTNKKRVFGLETADTLYLLGPAALDEFMADVMAGGEAGA